MMTSERRSLLLRPSSRAVTVGHRRGLKESSGHSQSGADLSSRRRYSLTTTSKVLEKRPEEALLTVLDEDGNNVTPQSLLQSDPGASQTRSHRFFVEEISALPGSLSDQTTATGSLTVPFSRSVWGSSRISSQSTIESVNEEIEDTFSRRDVPLINLPDVQVKRDAVEEQVTEDMLKDIVHVSICETDTVSLLDLPCSAVSVDADDAQAVTERNNRYADVCKNRTGNDKFWDRSMQTLNGAVKNKHVQSDIVISVDSATAVTTWDMYDTMNVGEKDDASASLGSGSEKVQYHDAGVDLSRSVDRSVSVGSTVSTASAASSLKDVAEVLGSVMTTESELQLVLQSERFHYCLMVMERSIMGNSFQPLLATYRQLPAELGANAHTATEEDPEGSTEKKEEVEEKNDGSPALQRLWTFSCQLSRGRRVSSLVWNKRNQDLLAVGYGESDLSDLKPGLVCCWSLKNPTWPERVIHCDSAVTSLDFSAHCPGQLAVGTSDGTVAVYNVQNVQNQKTRVVSSSGCANKHSGPVWELRWTQQELSFTGEDKQEALVSASADGRISRWFIFNNGLDCIDLMKLKRVHHAKKKAGGRKTESVLSPLTPALCFQFHPTDSSLYLAGTWDGLVHKCSCSNTQQVMETFRKHFCPVNCVTWSPFRPDVFLSCSSDWTIQLWRRDRPSPVLGFTSAQRAVCDVQWSPKWACVFAAANEGQLEIWDLSSSTLDPVAVEPAAPGVTMTTLLFTPQSHCVLVGDSDGHVTVYQLKNLNLGQNNQADVLEGIVCPAASTQTQETSVVDSSEGRTRPMKTTG